MNFVNTACDSHVIVYDDRLHGNNVKYTNKMAALGEHKELVESTVQVR